MDKIRCGNCGKALETSMEVEYSSECNEYFCNPDCAKEYYFERMGSCCVDFENLPEDDVLIKNGKLYKNN